jgi:hypothetical protein
MDELEALETDVRDQGSTIKGARGQVIAHPALAAIARHRTMLAKLLAALETPETQSQQATRAARTRWQRHRLPAPRPDDRVYVPKTQSDGK